MDTEAKFTKEDRELFQLMIDNPYASNNELASPYEINSFCNKYNCSSQIQIIRWDLIGLHPFFLYTQEPVYHPYAVRTYKIIGAKVRYLNLCVAPNLPYSKYKELYPITKIMRPTNNVRLLYPESRTLTFIDHWLLTLKEVMVDEGHGEVIYQQEQHFTRPITVTKTFLETLREIYLRGNAKRFFSGQKGGHRKKIIKFIRNFDGFLSDYLNIQIPNMVDYVLILDIVQEDKLPGQFAGGFMGWFPLLELYETKSPNTLICRFQLPELKYATLATRLFLHLREVCNPKLYLLSEDIRMFDLIKQWDNGKWKPF